MSLLVLATAEGPEWGWGDGRTIGLSAAAAVFAAVTFQRTLRAESPAAEKELFRSRQFTAATIALLLYFTGFSVFPLGGAVFMQDVWHFSALQAGAGIAPATLELKELDEFPPARAVEHDSPALSFRPVIHSTGLNSPLASPGEAGPLKQAASPAAARERRTTRFFEVSR